MTLAVALPPDDRSRVLGVAMMQRQGAGVDEIADVMAITPAQVRRDMIAAGLEAGEMPVDLAARIGRSRSYVSRVARSLGWSQEAVIAARRARVERLAEQGVPEVEIAAQVAVSRRTVTYDRRSKRRAPPGGGT